MEYAIQLASVDDGHGNTFWLWSVVNNLLQPVLVQEPGTKGFTNATACLMDAQKALSNKWPWLVNELKGKDN